MFVIDKIEIQCHSVVIKNYLKLIVKVRFTCEVEGCGRDYSRKSTLKQHMKSAHEREDVKQLTIYLLSMWQVILSRYEAHCTLSRRSSLKDLYGTNIIVLGIVLACAISYSNKDIEVSKLEDIGVLRHCGLRLLQEKRVVNCMRLFYVKYERLKQ